MIAQNEITRLGLNPTEIRKIITLRKTARHTIYRLITSSGNLIIKHFIQDGDNFERRIYDLLTRLKVPTLTVLAQTEQSILLEDLETSPNWQLAKDKHMSESSTGQAIANWYHQLHAAGRQELPVYIQPWVACITEQNLHHTGEYFKLAHTSTWNLATAYGEHLRDAYLKLPQTFNYNDFYLGNLAISRHHPRQVIVFDYDCFSSGLAYSDWRNVCFSLRGAALAQFQSKYGPVLPLERYLDEALAPLHGLIRASQRPQIPRWAKPLIESAQDGSLEISLRQALEYL